MAFSDGREALQNVPLTYLDHADRAVPLSIHQKTRDARMRLTDFTMGVV
jgi:hypothetical protein